MPSADSMPVKKGVVQDDDNRSLGSMLKGRKSAAKESNVKKEVPEDGNVASASLPNAVKKQEDEEEDNVPISVRVSSAAKNVKESTKKTKIKQEVKEKTKAATQSADQPEKKRERKVYDLPGQKRDPPAEREPLRIFYETLYNQIPSSEMAQFWMMESGLLEKEEAKRIFERKQKGNQVQKLSSSPAKHVVYNSVQRSSQNTVKKKVTTPVSSSSKNNNKKKTPTTEEVKVFSSKKQKRRNNKDDGSSDESDDDFVLAAKVTKKPKATAA